MGLRASCNIYGLLVYDHIIYRMMIPFFFFFLFFDIYNYVVRIIIIEMRIRY